jgi:TPR repeat protein
MLALVERPAEEGNWMAKLRLGRMYRFGKGVPKDLDKAYICMRDVAKNNRVPPIREEYFDFLYSMGDRRFHRAMADSVRVLAIKGAPGCQARYGLC